MHANSNRMTLFILCVFECFVNLRVVVFLESFDSDESHAEILARASSCLSFLCAARFERAMVGAWPLLNYIT